MLRLFGVLARELRFLLIVSILAGTTSGVLSAWAIARISKALTGEHGFDHLLIFCVLAAAIFLIRLIADLSLLHLGQEAVQRLRTRLSERLIDTPLVALERLGKGPLLAILTNDIATLSGVCQILPSVLSGAFLILACFVYLGIISWKLFAIVFVLLALSIGLYKLAERSPLASNRRLREITDLLFGRFRDLVEGVRELKLSHRRRELFLEEDLRPVIGQARAAAVRTGAGYAWLNNFGTLLYLMLIGLAVFGGPAIVSASPEVVTSFALVLLYVSAPIIHLLDVVPSIRSAGISVDKIKQLGAALDFASTPADQVAAAPIPFHNRIELQSVGYRFSDQPGSDEFELGPLSLTVNRGEVLFIVGGNGSGKTTLGLVLLGLYAPRSGNISVDGVAISSQSLKSYQALFATVLSDFYLFDRLVIDPASKCESEDLVALFRLSDKVRITDGRFSSLDLSRGQRRRLALIAALAEDRQVMLLDEWASDQDPSFKEFFYRSILPQLRQRGKTVIVITHDDRYFGDADRVIRMESGKIVDG